MIIDIRQLAKTKIDVDSIRADISHGDESQISTDVKEFDYKYLRDSASVDWNSIIAFFKQDFRLFDELLFRIHFKRKADLGESQRGNILKFLAIGYQHSKDVRYFNEFLWFYNEEENFIPLWQLTLDNFFRNLDGNNHHRFPLGSIDDVENFIEKTNRLSQSIREQEPDRSLKIGLMGSPTFFPKIRRSLMNDGFDVN